MHWKHTRQQAELFNPSETWENTLSNIAIHQSPTPSHCPAARCKTRVPMHALAQFSEARSQVLRSKGCGTFLAMTLVETSPCTVAHQSVQSVWWVVYSGVANAILLRNQGWELMYQPWPFWRVLESEPRVSHMRKERDAITRCAPLMSSQVKSIGAKHWGNRPKTLHHDHGNP